MNASSWDQNLERLKAVAIEFARGQRTSSPRQLALQAAGITPLVFLGRRTVSD
jgi:hypothetical protein